MTDWVYSWFKLHFIHYTDVSATHFISTPCMFTPHYSCCILHFITASIYIYMLYCISMFPLASLCTMATACIKDSEYFSRCNITFLISDTIHCLPFHPGLCSQQVTACFRLVFTANRLPPRYFLRGTKRYKLVAATLQPGLWLVAVQQLGGYGTPSLQSWSHF
jgi:hypothetical protein